MESKLTTTQASAIAEVPADATLLDMRADPRRFPRLRTYPREQAVFQMSRIVSQAFLYRGQTADQANVQFIASALVDELAADNEKIGTSNICFAEISRIVKKAVLTSDMYGISVSSLYRCIVEYVKGEGHRLAIQVAEEQKRKNVQSIKDSIVAPMLQVYAGKMLNKK